MTDNNHAILANQLPVSPQQSLCYKRAHNLKDIPLGVKTIEDHGPQAEDARRHPYTP